MNTMRLTEGDVSRLITACNLYKEQTGSEYIWDEYQYLIEKLEKLCDQGYCAINDWTYRRKTEVKRKGIIDTAQGVWWWEKQSSYL